MPLLTNLIRLTPPSMPVGWCPPTLQQAFNEALSATQVTVLIQQGNFLYNYGATTPAPENRVFPWLYTLDGRWYVFNQGWWTSPNPRPPDGEWIIWPDTEQQLWLYDGGDGTDPRATLPGGGANGAYVAPTDVSGAMWQLVSDMAGRFPLGAGDIPGTSPTRTAVLGQTGGEGDHSLTLAETAPHTHTFKVIAHNSSSGGSGALTGGDYNNPNDGEFNGTTDNAGGTSNGATPPVYTVTPHNNMSPYRVVNYAVRTTRRYYALPA